MGAVFTLGTKLHYFVVEYLDTNPSEVHFAWMVDTQDEAEKILLNQIRLHGDRRFYTAYAKFY